MAEMTVLSILILWYSLVDVSSASEWCTRQRVWADESDMMYCDDACCGDVSNRYCCQGASVVLIVIGCGAAACFIVCVVVAICCCRRRAATGRVLSNRQAVTRVTVGQPMSPYTVPMPTPPTTTSTTVLSGAYSHGYAQPPVTPYAGGPPQEEHKAPAQAPPSYEETMRQ